LLNATGGALKPEKCWWCLLDYTCVDSKWTYSDIVPRELGTHHKPRWHEECNQTGGHDRSKKTLGIYFAPAGGNKGHLDHIKSKAKTWIKRMTNGHLTSHIVWVAYRHQLWPGLRYGLSTMTNDIEPAARLLNDANYKTLSVLGIFCNVAKGVQKIHTTFGSFRLFNLSTEQLISRVNMFFQHYHASTNLSKKLDVSPEYLQLRLACHTTPSPKIIPNGAALPPCHGSKCYGNPFTTSI
jgi:hypothetical protein